jgi:hypothetical protein
VSASAEGAGGVAGAWRGGVIGPVIEGGDAAPGVCGGRERTRASSPAAASGRCSPSSCAAVSSGRGMDIAGSRWLGTEEETGIVARSAREAKEVQESRFGARRPATWPRPAGGQAAARPALRPKPRPLARADERGLLASGLRVRADRPSAARERAVSPGRRVAPFPSGRGSGRMARRRCRRECAGGAAGAVDGASGAEAAGAHAGRISATIASRFPAIVPCRSQG